MNIQAYSGQDPCHIPAEGVVLLNHHLVWNASYCGRYPNRRGVSVLDVDPFACRVNGVRFFDTWASSTDALDLSTYLQYVRDGALLIGVTGDEPMQQLSPVLALLRAAGVFVDRVPYRGNFAFVIQKGFSYKTITSMGTLTSPAKVDVRIKGEWYYNTFLRKLFSVLNGFTFTISIALASPISSSSCAISAKGL